MAVAQSAAGADVDVLLLGGGVAGLWLLNRLRDAGYSALLFDSGALGAGQSCAAQGMIHGGVKYALSGAETGASAALAAMPARWRRCLEGSGEIDLRATRTLSDHLFLWTTGALPARLAAFFAGKALRGRVDAVSAADAPAPFRDRRFRGPLYRLHEPALEVSSLLHNLAALQRDAIYAVDWRQARFETAGRRIAALRIAADAAGATLRIAARCFLFTAGSGNAALMAQLGIGAPRMQRRPLRQILVKHRYPHPLYGHCIDANRAAAPRLTVTAHPCGDPARGAWVWSLGGALADRCEQLSEAESIERARDELRTLLPWIDLPGAEWRTLTVDRAEPWSARARRPDLPFIERVDAFENGWVGWPIKLTLAPALADETLAQIAPLLPARADAQPPPLPLPRPPIAQPPWERLFADRATDRATQPPQRDEKHPEEHSD